MYLKKQLQASASVFLVMSGSVKAYTTVSNVIHTFYGCEFIYLLHDQNQG
jgi:hypothetical protein